MKNIALVLDGVVTAISVWDEVSPWNPGEQYTLLDVTDYDVSPGDEYLGTDEDLGRETGSGTRAGMDEGAPLNNEPELIVPLEGQHYFNKAVKVPDIPPETES